MSHQAEASPEHIDYDAAIERIIRDAIPPFKGIMTELETAIGALYVGQHVGWKPLLLIHDKKTLRKYEMILGISFREHMPEIGPHAHKSVAWKAVQKVSNFWKAVKGEIKGVRTQEVE